MVYRELPVRGIAKASSPMDESFSISFQQGNDVLNL
jgi:hypothetical protein